MTAETTNYTLEAVSNLKETAPDLESDPAPAVFTKRFGKPIIEAMVDSDKDTVATIKPLISSGSQEAHSSSQSGEGSADYKPGDKQ